MPGEFHHEKQDSLPALEWIDPPVISTVNYFCAEHYQIRE